MSEDGRWITDDGQWEMDDGDDGGGGSEEMRYLYKISACGSSDAGDYGNTDTAPIVKMKKVIDDYHYNDGGDDGYHGDHGLMMMMTMLLLMTMMMSR